MPSFKRKVIKGAGRGGRIGFHTLNFSLKNIKFPTGIYICRAKIGKKAYYGLLHYGQRKTFDNDVSLEVHLFDFEKNIYGKTIQVEVFQKIRGVRRFKNASALARQMRKDVEVGRRATDGI